MTAKDIAAAVARLESALQRRPEFGLQDDAPSTARWHGGLKVVATHANGSQVQTDMPQELGGGGQGITPGWLLRAALASCAATRIAMAAASEGIALKELELTASSCSDARGLFGMVDAGGSPISAGPHAMQLHVRICAPGIAEERLHRLVERCHRQSPVTCALQEAVPVALRIEIEAG
jgi:uncharacterized OsmC-like protein